MNVYILAPAKVSSGGPELAHQMCYEINKNGKNAYMYYIYAGLTGPADEDAIDKFKKYETCHVTNHNEADQKGNIVIIPEGLADRSQWFKNATLILWWMSVDNFYRDNQNTDIKILDSVISLHLSQSFYSYTHLLENGIDEKKIITVSDYISDLYGQFILPADYRKNIALYNPKKGAEELKPLRDNTPFLEWKPLINLTEEEMIVLMQIAKVYVDFGNHPGKDRIPREAALCGCCLVTNQKGSAAFYEDVSIPSQYKIDTTDSSCYEKAAILLEKIAADYSSCFNDFDYYRNVIKGEKSKFEQDVQELIKIM